MVNDQQLENKEESIIDLKVIEPTFQIRLIRKLRKELTEILDLLELDKNRRQYLIHQLSYCHELDHLRDLALEMNSNIKLVQSETGLIWVKQKTRALH